MSSFLILEELHPYLLDMPNTLFLQNKNAILDDYKNGMGCILIGKKYSIPPNTIHYNLHKMGVTRNKKESSQKYEINENFFSAIDTEEKAYLLGFIYADGCINETQLNVTLHPKDIEIIHFFIQYLSPTRLPSLVRNFYVKFGVYNRKLSNDLRRCGIVERKSLTIIFPSTDIVPKTFIHHFVRGLFDGDGSIFSPKSRPKSYVVKIVGSNSLIKSLTNIFMENGIHGKQKPKGNVSEFVINNNKQEIAKLYKFLYSDSNLYLRRKKEKFEEMMKLIQPIM